MRVEPGFIEAAGQRLECRWIGPRPAEADGPTLVFLHEGLGSTALWRDFPLRLARATGLGALVYTRQGYAGSSPCPLPRPVRYMHDEGLRVLPAVLAAAGIGAHILVGHSDGASIALIYAGGTDARGLDGLIVEAPHVFTEEMGLQSIAAAREAYVAGDLKPRLARHHGANADCALFGWADAWLDPAFRGWNLEGYLPSIRVPVLVIQGEDDEYGTAAQCRSIERLAGAGASVLMLAHCRHAPHRDQPDAVLDAMSRYVRDVAGRRSAAD